MTDKKSEAEIFVTKIFPVMEEVSGNIIDLINEKIMEIDADNIVCMAAAIDTISMVLTNMMLSHDEILINFNPVDFMSKVKTVALLRYDNYKEKEKRLANAH